MPEPILTMDADDDLPRTIRRERDAREARKREAREWEAREQLSAGPTTFPAFERQVPYQMTGALAGVAAGLDVPFSKLMAFFMKALFAAIPAFVVLIALLWLAAHGLQAVFPDLVKLKILIYMPN